MPFIGSRPNWQLTGWEGKQDWKLFSLHARAKPSRIHCRDGKLVPDWARLSQTEPAWASQSNFYRAIWGPIMAYLTCSIIVYTLVYSHLHSSLVIEFWDWSESKLKLWLKSAFSCDFGLFQAFTIFIMHWSFCNA